MGFVELTDGDEKHARARRGVGGEVVFDERLFDLDLAGFSLAGERVLHLKFASEAQVVGEIMAEEQHEAVDVDLVLVSAIVVDLAIAADLRVGRPAAGVLALHQGLFDEVAGSFHLDVGFEQSLTGLFDAGVVTAHLLL